MKKITIAATAALALAASTVAFAPAANAAPVAASSASFGAACATVGATAAGKGADGSALTCAKETHGSFKGKTIWTYKTWPVLKELEIVIPNSLTSGFGLFGKAVADSLSAEGLMKATPVVTPNKQASYNLTLDTINKTLAGKAWKSGVTGFAQASGALVSKSATMVSDGVPAARMMAAYEAIAVKADSKYKTITQLLADLENYPKGMTIVGGNKGGIDNFVAAKLFEAQSIPVDEMNYVPTKATVVGDLLSDAKYAFGISDVADFTKYVASGDLRILAVTSEKAIPGVNAPTLKSKGVNAVVQNWRGIMLPPSTPASAQKLVIRALDVASNSATFKKYLTDNLGTETFLPGAAWKTYLKSQEAQLRTLLKGAGLL